MIIGKILSSGQLITKDGKYLCNSSDLDFSFEWQDTAEYAIMYIPQLPSIDTLKQNFNVDMTDARLVKVTKTVIVELDL